jgi:hypothetical protein
VSGKFLHVCFSFTGPAPTEELQKVFDKAVDWVRYDHHGWILYTTTGVTVWRDRIRNTPGLRQTDSFFICDFDNYSGYMHDFVWDWLHKDRSK